MYYLTLPTINEAFVPPKPKEFDKATFTFFSLAFKGTNLYLPHFHKDSLNLMLEE